MTYRLTNPLPIRNWHKADATTWQGRLWKLPDVHEALRGGGWFSPSLPYAFDSPATAEYAFAAQSLLAEWSK